MRSGFHRNLVFLFRLYAGNDWEPLIKEGKDLLYVDVYDTEDESIKKEGGFFSVIGYILGVGTRKKPYDRLELTNLADLYAYTCSGSIEEQIRQRREPPRAGSSCVVM